MSKKFKGVAPRVLGGAAMVQALTYGPNGQPIYGDIVSNVQNKTYWPQLTRATRTPRGQPVWYLRCATPACTSDLQLCLHKAKGYTLCLECRGRPVAQYKSTYLAKHPEIVHADTYPTGGRRYHCACATPGCTELFWHQLYVRGRRQCLACDYKKCTYDGHPVRHPKLRAAYKYIGGSRLTASGTVQFLMRCRTPGCTNLYGQDAFLSRGGLYCSPCCNRSRRTRPYENQWRSLTKHRALEIGKAVPLSYPQFAALCALPHCFYCQQPLRRAKHGGTLGSAAALLDRIDSAGTYKMGNVVPCCGRCNLAKGGWLTARDFLAMVYVRLGDKAGLQQLLTLRKLAWDFIVARCSAPAHKDSAARLWLKPELNLWAGRNASGATRGVAN